jgi:hypothetical protein
LKRIDIVEAEIRADEAYRQTLPDLVGYENIRDFIACVYSRHGHLQRHRTSGNRAPVMRGKSPCRESGRVPEPASITNHF